MPMMEIIIVWAFVLVVAAAITFVAFPAARAKRKSDGWELWSSARLKRLLGAARWVFLCFFVFLSLLICADWFIHIGLGRHVGLAP
jgi:hypothetical protein